MASDVTKGILMNKFDAAIASVPARGRIMVGLEAHRQVNMIGGRPSTAAAAAAGEYARMGHAAYKARFDRIRAQEHPTCGGPGFQLGIH